MNRFLLLILLILFCFATAFVKIYDSRTGALLQTVAHPLIRVDLQGKQHMTHGKTVESANWSKTARHSTS